MLRNIAKARSGMALLPIVIGVAAVGLLIYPILRWYFSMVQGTANIEDKLEMQIIMQEYLSRINAATYDEIVHTIATKGNSWTEDVKDGKYEVKYEFGEDGKFADAKCDTEATISDGDKRCRTATITLTSKSDPTQVMNLSTISVSVPSRIPEIERRLAIEEERFKDYYTKTEADTNYACPQGYSLVSNRCQNCTRVRPTGYKYYYTGDCQPVRCPTGQKGNADRTGCEAIVCPSGKVLQGDSCCATSCPAGYFLNGCSCSKIPDKLCIGSGGGYFNSTKIEHPHGSNGRCYMERLSNMDRYIGNAVLGPSGGSYEWDDYKYTYTVQTDPGMIVSYSCSGNMGSVAFRVPIVVLANSCSSVDGVTYCYKYDKSALTNITIPAGTLIHAGFITGIFSTSRLSLSSC